jgi:hypothetical protein
MYHKQAHTYKIKMNYCLSANNYKHGDRNDDKFN